MSNALPPTRYIATQNGALFSSDAVFYVECSLPVHCTNLRTAHTPVRKRSRIRRIFGL